MMKTEFGKCGAECLNTGLPLPTLLCTGKRNAKKYDY